MAFMVRPLDILTALSGAMRAAWRAAGAGSSREESRDRLAQSGLGHARHVRSGNRGKPRVGQGRDQFLRSEERRVGKACGSTCRSRGSPDHQKKNKLEKSI